MTDPQLGDSQAASGGRRDIPLVPHLVLLTEWDHLLGAQFLPWQRDIVAELERRLHDQITVPRNMISNGFTGTCDQ